MNKELIEAWISFMRTSGPNGEAALKTVRKLCRIDGENNRRYCCLGAACEVGTKLIVGMGLEGVAYIDTDTRFRTNDIIPSDRFASMLGIDRVGNLTREGIRLTNCFLSTDSYDFISLAGANDYVLNQDVTLKRMADLIQYLYYCQELGVKVFA